METQSRESRLFAALMAVPVRQLCIFPFTIIAFLAFILTLFSVLVNVKVVIIPPFGVLISCSNLPWSLTINRVTGITEIFSVQAHHLRQGWSLS